MTARPVLADAEVFADAPCVGRHVLFDAADPDEDPDDLSFRVQAAVRLCTTCPVQEPCAELLDTLPVAHQSGVWAGLWWRAGRARRTPEPTITTEEDDL